MKYYVVCQHGSSPGMPSMCPVIAWSDRSRAKETVQAMLYADSQMFDGGTDPADIIEVPDAIVPSIMDPMTGDSVMVDDQGFLNDLWTAFKSDPSKGDLADAAVRAYRANPSLRNEEALVRAHMVLGLDRKTVDKLIAMGG